MQTSNYECKDCQNNWEFVKDSIKENFPEHPECPQCQSINTMRDFSQGSPATYVAEGKVGNAKTGYKTNVVAHNSPYQKRSNAETAWE